MKKQILLASILGSSVAFVPLQAQAQTDRIANAQAQLREFEKKHGTKNKNYYFMLVSVAQAYHESGKRKEANEYYQKALAQAEKLPNGKSLVAYQKVSWANFLLLSSVSTNREDRATALDLLHEHEKYLDAQNSPTNEYLNLAATYYRIKDFAELKKIEAKITEKLDAQAKAETSKGKIAGMINAYFVLGSMHVEKKNRQSIGIASNKEELEKATAYFQKAIALCERLPENDSYAIDTYRRVAQFYQANGKNELAAKYTKILAKALKTSDPAVLFPPIDLCPACGRG